MAKRSRKTSSLDSAAVTVGSRLGALAGRVDAVKAQQQALAAELRHVIRTAQGMLADIGAEASASAAIVRRSGRKKRNLSPEGRAAIIAATKRRWARHHAAKGKK